ncbi:hypothetical protein L0128_05775, partial [candidate division KSB1 bacterium]|nr:hypothetical protein [candidate division KSB1 bacterium]
NKIFLEVERRDQANSASAFVLRTPFGGMAFEGYLMQWDAEQQRLNFYLNIPAFLQECLTYIPPTRLQPMQLITHREILAQARLNPPDMTAPPPVPPPDIPAGSTEIKRWILALYDGAEAPDLDENPIRKRAEIILNHLGLVVQHWDIRQGFPDAAALEKYRGILTWFQDATMRQPEKYTEWLGEQIHAGRKVVVLGNLGAFYEAENNLPAAGAPAFFNALGLRYWDVKISPGEKQRVHFLAPAMLNFEAPVDLTRMARFETKITSAHPANQVFLTIEDEILGQIDAVVVTPFGGIALDDAPFQEGHKDAQWIANLQAVLSGAGDQDKAETDPIGFWRINPFKFFEAAFDLKDTPRPDFTTLNGRRIFYSHIDGDGLVGISLIDGKSYASEFVRDQILTQYPLPFSASVITKEIEDNRFPFYNRPLAVARSIFALDNVEAGTHSYSHPFNWRTGDLAARTNDHQIELAIEAIDYDLEIQGSVRFIEKNLLPPEKSLKLYLWSGQCNPDARALSRVDNLGITNMNWGDPIYDSRFPSYSCLAPLATNVNGHWQFHTSASNDFIYTKGWTRNFGNMAQLVEHFQHTESPIRMLPLNIYLHYYIGDREAGLTGLKKAYDYCMQQAIAPLFTSDFVNIGRDFIQWRAFKLPDGGYQVYHDGALRTLRFDHCTQYPDLKRSQGVIGFLHYQGALYVHLAAGNAQTIYLQPTAPTAVYLMTGSHYIDSWQGAPNGGQFTCRGVGKAGFELANLLPTTTYQVRIEQKRTESEARETVQSEAIQTDASGILKFKTIFKAYQGEYVITFTQL